jgi:signal transduction histidine kinase
MKAGKDLKRRIAASRAGAGSSVSQFVGGPLRAVPQLVLLLDQTGLIARASTRSAGARLGEIDCRAGRTVHDALHPGCDGTCTLSTDWARAWQVHHGDLAIEWEVEPEAGRVGLKLRLEPMRHALGELFGAAVRGVGSCSILSVQNIVDAKRGDGAVLVSEASLHGRLEPFTLLPPPRSPDPPIVVEREEPEEEEPLHEDTFPLLDPREAERQRIAAELHDSLGQTLSLLRFEVENCIARARVDGDHGYDDELQRIYSHAQRSLKELREVTRNLRSSTLATVGLKGSLEALCGQFRMACPEISIRSEIDDERNLPRDLAFAVFRVAQEALNNICRHSRAKKVLVVLAILHGGVELIIRDDGKGLPIDGKGRRGLGLGTMRERVKAVGGRFELTSRPDKGCLVRASWDAQAVQLLRQ